jgi:UDP-N-acetylmuramoyl-tripeptide--D-alanyl-D-alanine ligase
MKIIQKELAFLARWVISRFRPYVIGVSGSVGKTTTKYFIGELLSSAKDGVRSSTGNLNTETGLPLAILGYKSAPRTALDWVMVFISAPIKAIFTFNYPKYIVLEYAADKPGDIKYLTSIVEPDVAVITSLGVAHLEKFKDEKAIAREKWNLALSAKEAVVINKKVSEKVQDLDEPKADLYILPSIKMAKAENVNFFTNRSEFDFYLANKKFQAIFAYLGNHNIENLELAAFAAHLASGEVDLIVKAIKDLTPQDGRGRRFVGKKDVIVLDESYNANPASMRAALEIIEGLQGGRKVAVIGEMKEIGSLTEESHRQIAKEAGRICDIVIGVGTNYKDVNLDRWYPSVSELEQEIVEIIEPGDIILVKGSRSNKLDRIVELLK